jgi:hypothetical protein
MSTVFLLSPANCSGARGRILLSGRSPSELAVRLREGGAPLGEIYTFLSGLYFRGKLAYARAFARPPDPGAPLGGSGILVITPSAGLRSPDTPITMEALQGFARVDVRPDNPNYRRPLEASARALAAEVDADTRIVLLGSVASPKYVDVLVEVFGQGLVFPAEFVGRGDMSRGGLLLRQVLSGVELEYVPVAGAVRHGSRPPKLTPLRTVRQVG